MKPAVDQSRDRPGAAPPDDAAAPPTDAPPPAHPDNRLLWLNFFALLPLAVGVSYWLIEYTDWFAGAMTLLTLGGVLSSVAFLVQLMPPAARSNAQSWFQRKVLGNRRLPPIVLALGAGFWLFSLCVGSIELTLAEGSTDRRVLLEPPAVSKGAELWVKPGHPERLLFWKAPFRPAAVAIKVSGYPRLKTTASSWHLRELRAPNAFLRRVLLLRPATQYILQHRNNPLAASVVIDREKYPVTIGADAVWVGCDEDVAVPESTQLRWLAEVPPDLHHLVRLHWLRPRGLRDAKGNLLDWVPPGAAVQVTLTRANGAQLDLPVEPWPSNGPFPQVVDVKEEQ